MNHQTSPRPLRPSSVSALALGLITLFALVAAACGGDAEGINDSPACDRPGRLSGDAVVMVLTDTVSPSFDRTMAGLLADPAAAFDAAALNLEAATGSIVVSTYDRDGIVTDVATGNLAGVGGDEVRQEGSTQVQARCLEAALATIVAPGEGNLLRALPFANAVLDATAASETALVVHGFARSENDGFAPAEADLSDIEGVLELLRGAGVLERADRPVVLVDPAEGVSSSLAAREIRDFATSLCDELSDQCTVQPVLG